MRVGVDGEDVERVGRCETKALALAYGEALDSLMAADDLAGSGDQFAGGVGELFILLIEVGLEKAVVVAAGDEAYLLRVGLGGDGKTGFGGHVADFGLAHLSQWEQSA